MSMIKKIVQNSIERAKAIRAAKRLERDSEDAALAVEITVVERHSGLCERLAKAQEGFTDLGTVLRERYDRDFVPTLAAQLSCDSNRLELLAVQLAAIEAIKASLPRLLVEFKKCTIDVYQADLKAFEAEHRDILRKHAAIS